MNTVPIGRTNTAMALSAPAVVAASGSGPRCDTMIASAAPMTTCVERETTTGQARARRARRVPRAGRAAPSGRASASIRGS
jgi:hypothetical protein